MKAFYIGGRFKGEVFGAEVSFFFFSISGRFGMKSFWNMSLFWIEVVYCI